MNRRRFLWAAGVTTASLTTVIPVSADSHQARIIHDGEHMSLETTTGTLVEGQTQFAAGVPLQVVLRSDGESSFHKTTETTVHDDGTFDASFDLTDVPVGAPVTATVNWYQYTIAQSAGRTIAADPSITLSHEGDEITLAPTSGQTVTGTTSLPEGEPLVLRLKAASQSPFLKSDETKVNTDGSFTATFDFSETEPGTTFTVAVLYAGEQWASGEGVVSD